MPSRIVKKSEAWVYTEGKEIASIGLSRPQAISYCLKPSTAKAGQQMIYEIISEITAP